MKKQYLIMIAMLMLILAACGGKSNSNVGSWELVSHGSSSTQTPAVPDVDTSLEFTSDGQVSGNVGCNGFGGDYEVAGDQITFNSIVSTLMACEEPIAAQEAAVLKTFTDTATYDLDGNALTITSADGTTSVVLARK